MKPFDASKKITDKTVLENILDKRKNRKPQFQFGDLIRTADMKKTFFRNKMQQTSQIIYTQQLKQFKIKIHHKKNNFLPERYKENLLRSTNLTVDENNKVMKKFN